MSIFCLFSFSVEAMTSEMTVIIENIMGKMNSNLLEKFISKRSSMEHKKKAIIFVEIVKFFLLNELFYENFLIFVKGN